MSRPLRLALAGSPIVLLPFLPWIAFAIAGGTPSGLRVDGATFPSSDTPEQELARRADAWLGEEIRVSVDDVARRRTRRELGARIDVDRIARRASAIGRSGAPWRDLPALFSAWSGATDLAWPVRIDARATRAFVRELAQEIDRPPRPARVDARGDVVELSADGARVVRADAVRALMRALRGGHRAVTLPVERIGSGVGDRALAPVLHPRARPIEIGRYTTRYRTRGGERDRAHNVATAASFLDGAVIPAHGRLSFNERVGPRDRSRGYRDAHVILDGEMVDGIGGGVCQVASTLHAAAFLAGLDIVQHAPHSRPSEYIPMGLDATVVWPSVDLVIASPFSFPVTVRAVAENGELTITLHGLSRARRVDWRASVVDTEPFGDRYVEDPALAAGETRVTQRGIRGFAITRERTIEASEGLRVEETRLRYPPTDRVVHVAPGALDPTTGRPVEDDRVAAIPQNPF